ncbi:MAG: hypothetical protein AAF721_14825 [Myxococcota bacterium]
MKIGIDIGRVIIRPAQTAEDTSFLHGSDTDAMKTPPSHGAFDTIARIAGACDGQVWLVSKCGPNVERRSRAWLAHWGFTEATGIRPANFRFCRQRRDKGPIAAKLQLDAFIDDRPDIIRHLAGVVPLRYLFGPQKKRTAVPHGATHVADWAEVAAELLPVLRDGLPRNWRAAALAGQDAPPSRDRVRG